jgi:hypothetical protein
MPRKKTRNEDAEAPDAKRIETARSFSESCPDGFVSDTPEWVAYCPECGAKLPLEDHLECAHYRGADKDASGETTAIECAYVQKPRIRPRTKTRK